MVLTKWITPTKAINDVIYHFDPVISLDISVLSRHRTPKRWSPLTHRTHHPIIVVNSWDNKLPHDMEEDVITKRSTRTPLSPFPVLLSLPYFMLARLKLPPYVDEVVSKRNTLATPLTKFPVLLPSLYLLFLLPYCHRTSKRSLTNRSHAPRHRYHSRFYL